MKKNKKEKIASIDGKGLRKPQELTLKEIKRMAGHDLAKLPRRKKKQ